MGVGDEGARKEKQGGRLASEKAEGWPKREGWAAEWVARKRKRVQEGG